jgi:hypothetical protein
MIFLVSSIYWSILMLSAYYVGHHFGYKKGKQVGKEIEHEHIWTLIQAACCHPIDGDKLKEATFPKALPNEKNG